MIIASEEDQLRYLTDRTFKTLKIFTQPVQQVDQPATVAERTETHTPITDLTTDRERAPGPPELAEPEGVLSSYKPTDKKQEFINLLVEGGDPDKVRMALEAILSDSSRSSRGFSPHSSDD